MPPSSRWPRRLLPSLGLAAVAVACAEQPASAPSHAEPIYWGEPADGYDGVVMLTINFGGGMGALCSGTLVAPRVVVTAKHCTVDEQQNLLDARAITVSTGPTGGRDTYDVVDVRRAGGRRMYGDDFAVVITEDIVAEDPYPYASDDSLSTGDPVTLVGYGQRDDGDAGTKYVGDNEVDQVFYDYFFTTGESACHGDSGGPAFDDNGVLVGVIVNTIGGWDGGDSCASGISGVTRLQAYHDIVDEAVQDACVPEATEKCGDGLDNDCDQIVDQGCLALGAPCADGVYCASGDCRDSVCVQACTPGGTDEMPCPAGTYCDEKACGEGLCTTGDAGEGELGDPCGDDTDCRSLTCIGGRCLTRCGSDAECVQGETCKGGGEGGCGACTPDAPLAPFGAACAEPTDCASGICLADAFGSICSAPCTDSCPDGFACVEGQCTRPAPGGLDVGAPCTAAADCASGLCGNFPDGKACTDFCDPTDPCPAGLTCLDQEEAKLCTPEEVIEGQRCASNDDCLTGLCGNFDDFQACTAACGEADPCPAGFVCQIDPASDENGYCRPLEPPDRDDDSGGCGCRAAGTTRGTDAAWFVLVAAAAVVVSRARRRRSPRTRKEAR